MFNETAGVIAIAVTLQPLEQNPGIAVVVTCSGTGLADIRCDENALEAWQAALQIEDPEQVLAGAAADPALLRR